MKLQNSRSYVDRPFLIHLFFLEESIAFDFSLHERFSFLTHHAALLTWEKWDPNFCTREGLEPLLVENEYGENYFLV